jgi:acyl-CoA dehydrogenase
MDFALTDAQHRLRDDVRALCAGFPDAYWREVSRTHAYPEAFVRALIAAGYLAALIPREYGGLGLGVLEASLILEEIDRAGGNAGACHAQMYVMGTLLRHGSAEQKARYLPRIARGELRLQAFSVTEREAGSDSTRIRTSAVRAGDHYVVNGEKNWTSRALHSDLLLLLARTSPATPERRTHGLSVFLVDLRAAGDQIEIRPTETMVGHQTNEVTYRNLEVPAENLIGAEGEGFRYIVDGWNAERILIAGECIGDGRWFIERAVAYASSRVVFGRPLGQNQGIQFPLAHAHAEIEAADLMRFKAATRYDAGEPCGAEANLAKLLSSEAAWHAANACLDIHGGNGFAVEYDVERKFRETRLYTVAPVGNNLILAHIGQHVLGLPRSY